MMLRFSLLILLDVCTFVGFGCAVDDGVGDRSETETDRPLGVYVVNYPLQYFAARIGGDFVSVTFPAPAHIDPAHWSPTASTIAAYQSADLILLNGAGYAKWIEHATLPTSRLVDTSQGFRDRLLPLEDNVVHTHGPGGEHSHKGIAFTTWLDPDLAMAQARAVAASLMAARPDLESEIAAGLAALVTDLDAWGIELSDAGRRLGNRPILFSHPVYQYLSRAGELNGRAVHWEPDQAPDTDMWRELEALLETHPARVMVWEAAPLPATTERLRSIGIESVVYAPVGNRPASGDFLDAMRAGVTALHTITE